MTDQMSASNKTQQQHDKAQEPAALSIKENLERFFEVMTLKKFPILSYVIVGCSLLENFCESGLIGLMAIYLQTLFNLESSGVAIAFHLYYFCKYFAVLVGAVLADSYFDRVKLIIVGLTMFFVGNILLTLSSTVRMKFPSRMVLFLALLAKVIGPGLILPCIVPLAASQIEQTKTTYAEMKAFFVFYFAIITVCDLIAKLFLPLVLQVSCFELESCYPLAFGIPAIVSCLALVIFVSIRKYCYQIRPQQPIIIQGLQCCWHAFRMKCKKRKVEKREHWLFFADDKFDIKFIEDIKSTLEVLTIPYPMYWSLSDQQFTTWTLQAARLNTVLTSNFQIMPEQTQAFGPFFLLVFIPIFHFFAYDLAFPFRFLRTLLRRMVTGGYLIAMTFLMAYYLQVRIEVSNPDFPGADSAYIYLFSGLDSVINIKIENQMANISPYGMSQLTAHLTEDVSTYSATITYKSKRIVSEVKVKRKEAVSYIAAGPEVIGLERIGNMPDNLQRYSKGRVRLRVICVHTVYCQNATLYIYPKTWYIKRPREVITLNSVQKFVELRMLSGIYEVHQEYNDTQTVDTVKLGTGGVYTIMAYINNGKPWIKSFEITPSNKLSVLWMIPQYVMLSISSVLFKTSAYAFIYTETPDQMKSLAWSMCYMNLSTGNMIVVLFGGTGKPSTNFLIFGLGMFVFMLLFIRSAAVYKYKHEYEAPPLKTKKSLLNIF